jgi:SAM-dependent methyltransferase
MQTTATLETICLALQNRQVSEFVHRSVRSGYREVCPDMQAEIDAMLQEAFDQLASSQRPMLDPHKLLEVTQRLLEQTFRKGDPSFWFNQAYHRYKTQSKPEDDFRQLHALIAGERLLDYGSGSGYLAARLARGGYQVITADVLDYRYPEARHLPFVRLATPTDLDLPGGSIDTAVVQAVLHHIDPQDLPTVLQRLAQVARRVLIKEDTYQVPAHLPGLADTLARQPLLGAFIALSLEGQFQALALIDFFANAIAQGIPQMNMPFAFKTVQGWRQALQAQGLPVIETLLLGFETGRMHKSCHAWFICESTW